MTINGTKLIGLADLDSNEQTKVQRPNFPTIRYRNEFLKIILVIVME